MNRSTDGKQEKIPYTGRKKMGLPLLALFFDFLPFIFLYCSRFFRELTQILLLSLVLFPVLGLTFGVQALGRGKQVNGLLGKAIAILAIALPLLLLACIVVFFIGVSTGMISLM